MYVLDSVMNNEEFLGRATENLKRWVPRHQPSLIAVGVGEVGSGEFGGDGGGD